MSDTTPIPLLIALVVITWAIYLGVLAVQISRENRRG